MRTISIVILSILVLSSCSKNSDPIPSLRLNCIEVDFDEPVKIKVEERVCTPDGNEFRLVKSVNALCPCEVECVWQGYVDLEFNTTLDQNDLVINTNNEPLFVKRDSIQGFTIQFIEFEVEDDCPPMDMGDAKYTIAISKY